MFILKFLDSYSDRQTSDEGLRTQLPKRCDNNKEDDYNGTRVNNVQVFLCSGGKAPVQQDAIHLQKDKSPLFIGMRRYLLLKCIEEIVSLRSIHKIHRTSHYTFSTYTYLLKITCRRSQRNEVELYNKLTIRNNHFLFNFFFIFL